MLSCSVAGARQAPPGKKDGGRELMTLTEWIGALARLAWQACVYICM